MPGILDLPTDDREREAIIDLLAEYVPVIDDEIPAGEDVCFCYCCDGATRCQEEN